MKNFYALRTIAKIFRIFAYLTIIITIISCIFIVTGVGFHTKKKQIPSTTFNYNNNLNQSFNNEPLSADLEELIASQMGTESPMSKTSNIILMSVFSLFIGFIASVFLFAISETIILFLQIEINTRQTVLQTNYRNKEEQAISSERENMLTEKDKSALFKKWREENPKKPLEDFYKFMNENHPQS